MLLIALHVWPFVLLPPIVLTLFGLLRNYFSPGLYSIPGPFVARFTNLWRFIDACKGHHERTMIQLHEKYGPVVRIGPNVVSVADPAAIEAILGLKANLDKTESVRPLINTHEGQELPMLIAAIDSRRHAQIRRPVAGAYSLTNVLEMESFADETINTLVMRLRQEFVQGDNCGKTCLIDQWMSFFSFDFILRATFSNDFGFLASGSDIDGMLRMLDLQFAYICTVGAMPWLDKWLLKNPLLLMLIKTPNPLVDFAFRKITDRMQDVNGKTKPSEKGDFLSRFMDAQRKHPDHVSDLQLMTYTTTNVLAASDTTSVTLSAAINLVLRHPSVLNRLQAEIDEAELTSFPVPYKEAQKLPYLDAVIKEVFRTWPAASIELERKVGRAGLVLPTGHNLSPGTIIGLNAWPLHHDTKVFGQNAESFEPERWLRRPEETEEEFELRSRLMQRALLTFGAGPRACLGKFVASLEIYKVIPTLFGLFDVSPSYQEYITSPHNF
jgi:cytochrome P450